MKPKGLVSTSSKRHSYRAMIGKAAHEGVAAPAGRLNYELSWASQEAEASETHIKLFDDYTIRRICQETERDVAWLVPNRDGTANSLHIPVR